MGVLNKCSPPKQSDILASDESVGRVARIQLLNWICSLKQEDCSCIWDDVVCKEERVKKKRKGCKTMKWCKQIKCKKEKAVNELFRFMKIVKGNIAYIKRYIEHSINCKNTSIEPTFVLAHLSAKLLQFEKRIKNLPCSKIDNCHLAILMRKVRRNILLQFICGPQANEELARTVRDIAYIDCLLKKMETGCLCSTSSTSNKAVNTDKVDNVVETCNSLKKEDKETTYDCCKQKNYPLDCQPLSKKHWLYTNRERNCTKKTEFGNHKKNITYYYDVRQVNRWTSTTDIIFEGDILYPNEEIYFDDNFNQTEPYFTFKESYEITTMCLSYKHESIVNELDELPKLENVTNDFIESNFDDEKCEEEKAEGVKIYMNKVQGRNIFASTKTDNNSEELTMIYNNETSTTYITTGNSPEADSYAIALKQEIFDQVKKVATQFVKNLNRERNR